MSDGTAGGTAEGPLRVAFVCSGNICRSPAAEVVSRAMLDRAGLGERVVVDSYGTGPWEVGNPVYPPMQRALRSRGYDPDGHTARQVRKDDLAAYDLVLALDHGHQRTLRQLRGEADGPEVKLLREYDEASGPLDVDDPYYGDSAMYERVLDEIEAACRGLVVSLRADLS